MSKRAEQFARKLYTPWSEDGMSRKDNTEVIEACIKGYEQAEKELELTWQDMMLLRILFDATDANQSMGALTVQPMTREYYEYLLQEFNRQRKK